MKTPSIKEVIAAARAGDAEALALVRGWVTPATAQTPPRRLLVRSSGMLLDADNLRPRRRRDVFEPPPAFGSDDPLWQGLAPLTRAACDAVRACAPLAHHLQRQAARHLWALERRLQLDDTLAPRERPQLARELQQLQSLARPLWENWVYATPAWRHDQFDAAVNAWLDAPIDWSEQRWFMPDWRERPFGPAAAGHLVASLTPQLRQYLGLLPVPLQAGRFQVTLAHLAAPAEDATGWAQRIGLPWRFEAAAPEKDQSAEAAGTGERACSGEQT